MLDLIKAIEKKVNSVILSLYFSGAILIIFCLIILWYEFWFRVIVATMVAIIALVFIRAGNKLNSAKKDIKKHFKL